MRAIVIGSELISLATARYLSEMGYEVTIIEDRTEASTKQISFKEPVETQIFRQQLENAVRQYGVNFRYGCIAKKLIIHGKRIRGVVIQNEYGQPETMMADRFIATLDSNGNPALASLGIYSPFDFKPFNHAQQRNPLIGKSRYANLYLNIGYSNISPSVISQSGKQLADFVFNPSIDDSNSSTFLQSIQTRLSAYSINLFSMLHRLWI